MNILVTGATGYLGSFVLDALASEHSVVGVSRGLASGFPKKFVVKQDISDYSSLRSLFSRKKFDAVIHLAAVTKLNAVHPQNSLLDVVNTNAIGSLNLLKCAAEFNSAFVFASSMTVYGLPQYLPVDERHPCCPVGVYGCSKLLGEECVKVFSKNTGLKAVVVRLPGLFGKPRKNGAVYNFVLNSLENKQVSISLDEDLTWSVLHVEDAADAIVKSLNYAFRTSDLFTVFNAGYRDNIEITAFAKKIIGLANSRSKIRVSGVGKSFSFAFDTTKIRQKLGFTPRTLEERLNQIIGEVRRDLND